MEGIRSTLGILASLTPVVLLAFFFFVIYRTQSIYVLLARVWRIAVGAKPIEDQEIRRYADDIHSLTYFRFVSNLKVSSLAQAKSAIIWAERNRLDLRDVARCGDYFDVERLEIREEKIPTKRVRITVGLALLLASLATVGVVVYFSITDTVLLSFKDGGSSFKLSEAGAERYWVGTRLDLEACGRDSLPVLAGSTQFKESEAKMLCDFITDKGFKNGLDTYLRNQRESSWKIGAMLVGPLLVLFMLCLQVVRSLKLAEYLKARQR